MRNNKTITRESMNYSEYRNVKIPNIFRKWFTGEIAETKRNSNTKSHISAARNDCVNLLIW